MRAVSCLHKKHNTSTRPTRPWLEPTFLATWSDPYGARHFRTSQFCSLKRKLSRSDFSLFLLWNKLSSSFLLLFPSRITTITVRNSLAKSWISWKNYSKVFSQRYVSHFPSSTLYFISVCERAQLTFNLKQWEVKAPMPSQAMRSAVKQITKLHESLSLVLPETQVEVSC